MNIFKGIMLLVINIKIDAIIDLIPTKKLKKYKLNKAVEKIKRNPDRKNVNRENA